MTFTSRIYFGTGCSTKSFGAGLPDELIPVIFVKLDFELFQNQNIFKTNPLFATKPDKLVCMVRKAN